MQLNISSTLYMMGLWVLSEQLFHLKAVKLV